jgi:hypothetical protein
MRSCRWCCSKRAADRSATMVLTHHSSATAQLRQHTTHAGTQGTASCACCHIGEPKHIIVIKERHCTYLVVQADVMAYAAMLSGKQTSMWRHSAYSLHISCSHHSNAVASNTHCIPWLLGFNSCT